MLRSNQSTAQFRNEPQFARLFSEASEEGTMKPKSSACRIGYLLMPFVPLILLASCVAPISNKPPAAATPAFTPGGGISASSQTVTISDATIGATIHFTSDGSTPTASSPTYSGPNTVSVTETIQAIAVANGYTNSAVATATYTINIPVAATPTFSPSGGTFTAAQSITISDTTAGAMIYYSTNGTTPTTPYTGPIMVSNSENITAIAVASGYTNSAVASATYTINIPVAATPTFFPSGGTYTSAQSVTISDATPGAAIYYGLNGAAPSTLYIGPLKVSSSATVTAIAEASGYINSAPASTSFTINIPTAAAPTFSPPAGTFTAAQSVSIADTTPGATIYYGLSGAAPTTLYVGLITVSSTETITAIAVASGYTNSATASATYTINIPVTATPTFSPLAGTFTSAQSVTISDTTPGAAIYYGINGATPTTPYNGPINVSNTETVTAIAVAAGYTNSAVASSTYTINVPVVATPTFSLPTGIYVPMQAVIISDSTVNASIHFTTDGSTPTVSSFTYTGPFTVSSSETITAIAVASGYTNSTPSSATYTIYGVANLQTGTVYWGADGHRDKAGPYTSASLQQQIADLQKVFGTEPDTIFYRAWDDIVACGCESDITTLQTAGIIPIVGVITYPDDDPPCDGIASGWNNFISHPASGMTPEQTAYAWAYCTASQAVQAAPTNIYWYVGNTDDWAGSSPIAEECLSDGMAASDWNSPSVTSYPVYRGAMAGAIKAINDYNPSAKIIQGASGWTVGLSAALAADLENYVANGKSISLGWDYSSVHWATDVVAGTQYWTCNHPQYSGTMSFPDDFYDQPEGTAVDLYTLNYASGKPLFFDEFSSGDGNNSANDVAAGAASARLMENLLSHSIAAPTERGVVGGTYYELYQDASTAGSDRYLYYGVANIAPQGTAVIDWLASSQNASNQNPSTNTGPKFSLTGTTVTISSPGSTSNNTSTITVSPANGFTGSVAFTCEVWSSSPNAYVPATPSCSVSSATITGSTAVTGMLSVNTTAAPIGNYVVTVTGTGGGTTSDTTVNLRVN